MELHGHPTATTGGIPLCGIPVVEGRDQGKVDKVAVFNRGFFGPLITKHFRYLKWRNPHLYKQYVRLM